MKSRAIRYILVDTVPVVEPNLLKWGHWMETDARIIAQDTIDGGPDDGVRVSTVFLGLDHQFGKGPPILFETMIFGGEHHHYQRRYHTWAEAVNGHAHALNLAKGLA